MTLIKGNPQVAGQEIFSASSTATALLGSKFVAGDGREYRYVQCDATTAIVPGKLYQAQAETTAWEALAIAASAIGATSITTTATLTATLNQFAGGYVAVTATPGMGYQYKIKGNTAATGAVCTIYLEDPILVALSTASTIDVVLSPYTGVIIGVGSTLNSAPIGVAVYPIPASYYGYLQTKGVATVLADSGTVVVGDRIVPSVATAGAVGTTANTSLSAVIGYGLSGIASADYGFVMLNMA
jgi:hypothetical protein